MKKSATFHVRVVYGFLKKLEIVLLGEMTEGSAKAGMSLNTISGRWEIIEVLNMDFINQHENEKFIGLSIRCKNEEEFQLLKTLRLYDEFLDISPKSKVKKAEQ